MTKILVALEFAVIFDGKINTDKAEEYINEFIGVSDASSRNDRIAIGIKAKPYIKMSNRIIETDED